MAVEVGIDPQLHCPWKCAGLTPSMLVVSTCAVFRLLAVDTVAWDPQMHIEKPYSQYF